jgi:RND family efflux transporter MFP subunit
MRRLASPAAALIVLGLSACGREPGPPAATPAAAFATLVVKSERLPLERHLDGVIEAVNQGTVSAQTSGRVAEILYDVNDFVPAGAVIVRLRATEQRAGLAQAEAQLREAEARDREAESQHQRLSDMYERRLVAKAAYDEALAARDAARARLASARAGLDRAREGIAYTEIRAPYAGIVTRRHVEAGESVAPGSPLMSGISLQFLRVVVDVPQSIVEQVRHTRRAAIYVDGRRIEAAKLTVFPQASTPSNTFRARIDLPENATDLYPGMVVKAGFVVGEAERILVPRTALVQRGEVNAVYVRDARGRAVLRQVRVGHSFDDRVEILAGLRAGESVATDPVAALKTIAVQRAPVHD